MIITELKLAFGSKAVLLDLEIITSITKIVFFLKLYGCKDVITLLRKFICDGIKFVTCALKSF